MNTFNNDTPSYLLDYSATERQVRDGLEFILSHLLGNSSCCSRTISTKLTGGKQFTVSSRLVALSYFKDSNYLDCRISAYNPESKTVDFIMIDLDQDDFKSKHELNKAKARTLAKISATFKIKVKLIPVIWSGKGYHICIPVDSQGKILERISKFKKFTKNPSRDFLRFAEWYLSCGKCDIKHNTTVSFNNCMLRIPGSFNSKNNVQVRVIQKGDAATTIKKKLQAHLLHDEFLKYLINQSQKSRSKLANQSQSATGVLQRFYQRRNKAMKNKNRFISWIERLLQTGIGDDRHYCIWKIHVPYLINVKHLSSEQTFDIIEKWLHKCDKLEPLDFIIESKINSVIAHVGDFFPIGLNTLKEDNKRLYDIVVSL